jgi:abequosyltransferase
MAILIDILIPTYNRASFLKKNLLHLEEQIVKGNLEESVRILISDNHSPDETAKIVDSFKKENPHLKATYFRQQENIGLEPNVVSLMGKATSPFVLWVGDDDYLANDYLSFCAKNISNNPSLGCIIPGLKNLFQDGSESVGRIENFENKKYEAGFEACLKLSHLGHQMSGLLMNNDQLLSDYLARPDYRNPYLFIFWISKCLLDKGGIYAPEFKTGITTFNQKDWGYNKVGLLDQVFKSYYSLQDISSKELKQLVLRFSVLHSYRYQIRWNKPIRLIKQYLHLRKTLPSAANVKFDLGLHLLKDYLLSIRNAITRQKYSDHLT